MAPPNFDPNKSDYEGQKLQGEKDAGRGHGEGDSESDFATAYLARLNHEKKIADLKNTGIIYFPVGSMKFTLMCLCVPFHGYEIWWLYRNFVCQKERRHDMLSPMWRVNLPLLYLRKLLEAMREEGILYGLAQELPVGKIVLYWVLLIFCMLFPNPYGMVATFSFAPFIFVNDYLVKLNQIANPDLPLNTKFTPGNYLVIIVGGAYFAINIYLNLFFHL